MIQAPEKGITIFARFAIGLGFLSASMDRLGLWNGLLGQDQIAWGSWSTFVQYTHALMPWAPEFLAALSGGIATLAEVVFGLLLLLGWKIRLIANLSGILLLLFAVAMFSQQVKSPFDYSVFSAAAACFLLARISDQPK